MPDRPPTSHADNVTTCTPSPCSERVHPPRHVCTLSPSVSPSLFIRARIILLCRLHLAFNNLCLSLHLRSSCTWPFGFFFLFWIGTTSLFLLRFTFRIISVSLGFPLRGSSSSFSRSLIFSLSLSSFLAFARVSSCYLHSSLSVRVDSYLAGCSRVAATACHAANSIMLGTG